MSVRAPAPPHLHARAPLPPGWAVERPVVLGLLALQGGGGVRVCGDAPGGGGGGGTLKKIDPLEIDPLEAHLEGEERVGDFFAIRNGELYPTCKLKLFMVTTNPEIARKDCLLYFVARPA